MKSTPRIGGTIAPIDIIKGVIFVVVMMTAIFLTTLSITNAVKEIEKQGLKNIFSEIWYGEEAPENK